MWLVASDMDGRLPRDPTYIGERLGLYHAQSAVNLLAKLESKGLISQQDIRGDSRQSASTSQSRDRVEKEKEPPIAPQVIPQLELVAEPKPVAKPNHSGFDQFWQCYPRKIGKGAARRSWLKIKPDAALQAVIIDSVANHKASWERKDRDFIPYPSTYLNQERWKDEVQNGNTEAERLSKFLGIS